MSSLNLIGKEKIITNHAEVPFRVLEHRYEFSRENPENKAIDGLATNGLTLPVTTSNTSWYSRLRKLIMQ